MKYIDTDCRECGAKMPEPPKSGDRFAGLQFTVTAYVCRECGHLNDLSRRKKNKYNN